jgi:hypothetical protein
MIRSRGRRAAGLLAAIAGLAAGGCGPGAPHAESSLAEGTVTGRVMSAGKPITRGRVILDPANVNRPREAARTAEIAEDGTYKATTLVGENRITVAIPGRPMKKGTPQVQRNIEVRAGENNLDITVP